MDFDELDRTFEDLIKKFPQQKKKLVNEVGDKMYEKVLSNINTNVKEHTGNLKKSVTKKIGSKGGYAAVRPSWQRAPHTHLIENGHKIVKNKKVIGWVPGKHMYRNALNELADEIEQDAERMINGLVGDIFD